MYGAAQEGPAQSIKLALDSIKKQGQPSQPNAPQVHNLAPSFGLGLQDFETAFTYSTALGNILEMDDLARTAIVHPGPVIIPAALYTALQNGSSYTQLLEAIVRGYEAGIRLGNSLDAFHYQRWHPTSTTGAAGAAIACATILQLNNEQQLTALCNALSVSGGLWHTRHGDSMTKQWHSVHTARTGMNAARSGLYGFTAAEGIIEGEQGWHQVLANAPSPERIVEVNDWAILQTSFKPWPACRHCHAAIDAALKIQHKLSPEQLKTIASIAVHTYSDAKDFCDKADPSTVAEARFSLQHSIAVALVNGTVLPADFEMKAIQQSEYKLLRSKTTINSSPELTQNYPAHFGSTVTVELNSGELLTQPIVDAMGDPEWPLTEDQIKSKFKMLCDWGISDRKHTMQLAEAVLHASGNTGVVDLVKSAP